VAQAVLAGVVQQARTGRGPHLEVPMLDVMKAFILVEHGAGAVAFPEDGKAGYARVLTPQRGPQRTADGWINILPYARPDYEALFAAGGREDLVGDDRMRGRALMQNADFLYGEVHKITPQRTTAEWLSFCKANDIPVGVIGDLDEIVREMPLQAHAVVGDYRLIPPGVRYMGMEDGAHVDAPLVGQDSEAVLREAGLSEEEVSRLAESGVVRLGGPSTAPPVGGTH
jgi:crotonobetainyl-CoA:carnitine CoA-transferase CaiB-like acyl-CoA transferase